MQVLVSVNSVHEAQMALSAGVRLIDLKDTAYGALAALDINTSKSIIDAVNVYRHQAQAADIIVSATIGDDCTSVPLLNELIQSRLDIGVDVIKLPETIWANPVYQSALAGFLSSQIQLIAVLLPASLAGKDSVEHTMRGLALAGYWGVMVDTIMKSQSLPTILSMDAIALFVKSAKSLNLYVGLAGGLKLEQFDQLADAGPDYLGFRSGLCEAQRRERSLLPEKVQQATAKLYEIC